MRSALFAAAIALGPGLPVRAQCTWSVHHVPDFDQKRVGTQFVAGLPNNGATYCVPTAALNWFAYFANRGLPQPLGLSGPRSWQSQNNYPLVTQSLGIMGSFMGTLPFGGTGGDGTLSGAVQYSHTFAADKISIVRFWAGPDGGGVSPTTYLVAHLMGGFSNACYGYYAQDASGRFTRQGGHCITVVGQNDPCGTPTSILIRDPNDDPPNTTQSTFSTSTLPISPVTALFRNDTSEPFITDTRWHINAGTNIKFLDSATLFLPRIALTTPPSLPNTIQLMRPFVLEGTDLPATRLYSTPFGLGAVRGVCSQPYTLIHPYITAPIGGVSHLLDLDPVSGASTDRITGADFRYLEVNRFGEIYICDGPIIRWFDPQPDPPAFLGQVNVGGIPRAMAYDDATDTLAILSPPGAAATQLIRYSRALGAPSGSPLPPGVNPIGSLSLAFGRTGIIYLCGDGTATIWRMTQSGAALSPLPAITLPAGDQPAALSIDDAEHILISTNGVLREYEPDPNNRYIPSPTPAFPGFAPGAHLTIPRSRTNHLATQSGPGYADLLQTEVLPGTPDCYANCDFSTTPPILNVNDFACFLNTFAAGRIEANCDGSTAPPVLNVNDFACFLNLFASGCP